MITTLEELEQTLTKADELELKINKLMQLQKNFEEEISKCQQELAELKENKKEGKWKPQVGEEYYYRDSDGDDVCTYWYNDDANHWRVNNLPVFKTKEECERYCRFMDTVKEKSYEFSKEEWRNIKIPKYYIFYTNCEERLDVGLNWECRDLGEIYFKTEESAKYIIDNFSEELKEYWL